MTDDTDVVFEHGPEGSEEELEAQRTRGDTAMKKLKAELDEVKKQKQEYLDGWQRAKADYVNALKRFEEERQNALALGKILAVSAFIPVMDSLERAESFGEIPEAFKGIAKQLHEGAKTLGLSKFGVPGEPFDPSLHEALGEDLASNPEEDNKLTEVYEVGWKSGEAVVRPAKVRVASYKN